MVADRHGHIFAFCRSRGGLPTAGDNKLLLGAAILLLLVPGCVQQQLQLAAHPPGIRPASFHFATIIRLLPLTMYPHLILAIVREERDGSEKVVDLTKAVQWWQEEELRILVLASLVVQLFLIASTSLRKYAIWSWVRLLIWVAYLGCDALATLFNRHREQGGTSLLVLLWAPILLMHIGGHGDITAYNIEDNELWMRLVVTAWSQITVAVYVFCKSWPAGGDRMLLGAAILLFLQGAEECMNKASRLRFGTVDADLGSQRADVVHQRQRRGRPAGQGCLFRFVKEVKEYIPGAKRMGDDHRADPDNVMKLQPFREALDLLSPYDHVQLHLLKNFWVLGEHQACDTLRTGLSNTFDAIYTGRKIQLITQNILDTVDDKKRVKFRKVAAVIVNEHLLAMRAVIMSMVALALFHKSHKEGYSSGDVKVTYVLFACTGVFHLLFAPLAHSHGLVLLPPKGRVLRPPMSPARRPRTPAGCTAWCGAYPHYDKAARCREISNYMVHLLYENSEMLMVGARRNLFWDAYQEL
ncbi:hypothetical protein HU200_034061 [Digitaria exilis]|uniref:DUF4220 domain-containing protein n=1 Tax=Digitaria exilis TaxID=1010633 RepID=A0A835BJX1_9POAL|nr:hypothetical protein HU200_034061 [Digitaria exilis]